MTNQTETPTKKTADSRHRVKKYFGILGLSGFLIAISTVLVYNVYLDRIAKESTLQVTELINIRESLRPQPSPVDYASNQELAENLPHYETNHRPLHVSTIGWQTYINKNLGIMFQFPPDYKHIDKTRVEGNNKSVDLVSNDNTVTFSFVETNTSFLSYRLYPLATSFRYEIDGREAIVSPSVTGESLTFSTQRDFQVYRVTFVSGLDLSAEHWGILKSIRFLETQIQEDKSDLKEYVNFPAKYNLSYPMEWVFEDYYSPSLQIEGIKMSPPQGSFTGVEVYVYSSINWENDFLNDRAERVQIVIEGDKEWQELYFRNQFGLGPYVKGYFTSNYKNFNTNKYFIVAATDQNFNNQTLELIAREFRFLPLD